jgi:protein-L-isoaspartate(D-aspartate) O-methyltransferase
MFNLRGSEQNAAFYKVCQMNSETRLESVRRAYAEHILGEAGVVDEALENAFASVHREDYLPPGPWQILCPDGGYRYTPDSDPARIYTDDLVGISPERQINNGQPRLHAELLSSAGIQLGDHVVHVGAGTGYYSAIMSELVGSAGRITAIEFAPDLARIAKRNLEGRANTSLLQGDGSVIDFDLADVVYVNAGATRPSDNWLDRLKVGGRLILPLTTNLGFGSYRGDVPQGGVFRIVRTTAGFDARWVSAVEIFPCAGMRDEGSERALAAAFARGGWERVTRLYRRDAEPNDDNCWLRAPGWCLA